MICCICLTKRISNNLYEKEDTSLLNVCVASLSFLPCAERERGRNKASIGKSQGMMDMDFFFVVNSTVSVLQCKSEIYGYIKLPTFMRIFFSCTCVNEAIFFCIRSCLCFRNVQQHQFLVFSFFLFFFFFFFVIFIVFFFFFCSYCMYFTVHPTLAPLIKMSMFQPNMVCNIFTIFSFIMMWIIYVVCNWLLEMIGESCTAQPQIAITDCVARLGSQVISCL